MTEDIMAFALSLWPERKDLNPRTMREDVMLSILAAVVRRESLYLTSLIEESTCSRSDRVESLEHQVVELQKANTSEVERCRELGLSAGQLPEAADVDTPEDLRRLARVLQDQPELDCPRTRSLLASWGWL